MNLHEKNNIFKIKSSPAPGTESFETIVPGSTFIERIVSCEHNTPENQWYDQDKDEWVILLQGNASILFEDNYTESLTAGDYLFIPAHIKHRVTYTSKNPPCIWIAVHGHFSQ